MTYPRTDRTTSLRAPEKLRYDRETAHAILDEGHVCHIGYADTDGTPRVLPTAYSRVGETVYAHGSTGSRAFLGARDEGLDVCVTVTLLDGLIFGRSWFHHSMRFRCVMAHGKARLVTDPDEKWSALEWLIDALALGRAADSRPPTPKELAQTGVIAVPLDEVSVRIRDGAPNDEPEDLSLPYWAGAVPLRLTPGMPEADPGVTAVPPAYLAAIGETGKA